MSETVHRLHLPTPTTTASRFALSIGMSGLLMLFGAISFPLPWTPVPFSMIPLGLLMAGTTQRPGWAALSVVIYLAAGAIGVGVFAGGASGWEHFLGSDAGYLFAFPLVAAVVARHARNPRQLAPWMRGALLALFAASTIAGIAAIAWMVGEGGVTTSQGTYGVPTAVIWALVWITAATIAMTWWNLRGRATSRALDMWIVMMGAILLLHASGVTVLWLKTDLSLIASITLGSIVFLPFDILKAGLAVGATLPFLPSESEHA